MIVYEVLGGIVLLVVLWAGIIWLTENVQLKKKEDNK